VNFISKLLNFKKAGSTTGSQNIFQIYSRSKLGDAFYWCRTHPPFEKVLRRYFHSEGFEKVGNFLPFWFEMEFHKARIFWFSYSRVVMKKSSMTTFFVQNDELFSKTASFFSKYSFWIKKLLLLDDFLLATWEPEKKIIQIFGPRKVFHAV
jgi:hypothetical protein